jgi:hypothetical protein
MVGGRSRGHSSAGRASAWHAEGQEFESPCLHHDFSRLRSRFEKKLDRDDELDRVAGHVPIHREAQIDHAFLTPELREAGIALELLQSREQQPLPGRHRSGRRRSGGGTRRWCRDAGGRRRFDLRLCHRRWRRAAPSSGSTFGGSCRATSSGGFGRDFGGSGTSTRGAGARGTIGRVTSSGGGRRAPRASGGAAPRARAPGRSSPRPAAPRPPRSTGVPHL